MNEIGLDELLQLIIRDKGGSIQEYNQLMDYISFHETGPASRMDPKTKQISQKEDGTIYTGPGRGLFQFEEGEDAGGNLAVNRTGNYLKRNNITVPLWLKEIWTDSKSVDVSKLSSDQQKMLFLGYHREHPTSDFSKVWSGEQSIPQFWLNNHWGGKGSSTTEEVEEKLDLFNKSMIAKDSTDAINIRKAELFPKKDTVPFLSPSNDVETLPETPSVYETIFGSKQSSLLEGHLTYSSWEEGAKANPQYEMWEGKPNPYRHPSAMLEVMADPIYWGASIPKYALMAGFATTKLPSLLSKFFKPKPKYDHGGMYLSKKNQNNERNK